MRSLTGSLFTYKRGACELLIVRRSWFEHVCLLIVNGCCTFAVFWTWSLWYYSVLVFGEALTYWQRAAYMWAGRQQTVDCAHAWAHVVTRETIVCALCSFCQAATQHFRVRFLITDAYLYVMLVGLPLQAARTGLHADGTTFWAMILLSRLLCETQVHGDAVLSSVLKVNSTRLWTYPVMSGKQARHQAFNLE